MDLGPLIPIVAIATGFGWGWLGLQHMKLKSAERMANLESDDLRVENRKLAERIAVLERIATDKPSRLSAEIDSLAALPPKQETPAQS
jgi:hypothetical protein